MGTNNFHDAVEAWLMVLIQASLLSTRERDFRQYVHIVEKVGEVVAPRAQTPQLHIRVQRGSRVLDSVLKAGMPLRLTNPFALDAIEV